MIVARRFQNIALGNTTKPSASANAWASRAASSSGVLTGSFVSCMPSVAAALSVARNCRSVTTLVGSRMTATRVMLGNARLSNSNRLPLGSSVRMVNPVILPPGRAKLAARPLDDRNLMRGAGSGSDSGRAARDDHIDGNLGQLLCQIAKDLVVTLGQAEIENNRFSLDIAEILKPLAERDESRCGLALLRRQNPHPRDLAGLLRHGRITQMGQ